jgi:Lrp/AsnC family leucine-responsive transcriptional regulator
MTSQKLDKVDAAIMQILARDGRISWRDLAEQIGLSLTPTLRRIRRLESDGFITGYGAQFDEQKLGFGITMYVWVSLERQVEETLKIFERRIADVPEVMSCYLMTGEADYVLRIVVPDLPSYQRFMLDVLTRIPGVSRIQSSPSSRYFTAPPHLFRSRRALGCLSDASDTRQQICETPPISALTISCVNTRSGLWPRMRVTRSPATASCGGFGFHSRHGEW